MPFPFLFGGTFIEGESDFAQGSKLGNFPSFSEGLSLRDPARMDHRPHARISLPFRRDFH